MEKLLSCHIITYNQKDYIRQCIESVLMQQTKFDFEIIIGDDLSTDGTRDIVKEYAAKYPEKIRLNLRSERGKGVPGKENFISTLNLCRGKYISLCDGDDYWTDPLKLQKQVDFLEANQDYAICFHQTITLFEDGTELMYNNFTEDTRFEFLDLVQKPFISTVSSLFKNPIPFPPWYPEICGDWPLFLHVASLGKIYYMKDCMAVYRRHSGGIWSALSNDEKYNNTIDLINRLDKAFNMEYHTYFEKAKQLRYEIHYPTVQVPVKTPLLFRIKRKLKTLLFPIR